MNAVVLAGGLGSRLLPLTLNVPKPMLPLANVPMLDYSLAHLVSAGVTDIVFTLGHYSEQIKEFCSGYTGIDCKFIVEDSPLGTAGGVRAAGEFLDDTFIVLSGDAVEDIDFSALLHKHYTSGALVTMAVTKVDDPSLYGVVELDGYGSITGFCEKPKIGEAKSNLVNCGIYIIDKSVLQYIPRDVKYDFSRDLFPQILQMGKLSAYIHDGYWCDIGDHRSFYQANFYLSGGGFFPPIQNLKRYKYSSYLTGGIGGNLISSSASLVGACRSSIVGHGARIASGASVDNCIIMDNAVVTGRYLNAIIGQNYSITIPTGDFYTLSQNSTQIFNNIL